MDDDFLSKAGCLAVLFVPAVALAVALGMAFAPDVMAWEWVKWLRRHI